MEGIIISVNETVLVVKNITDNSIKAMKLSNLDEVNFQSG